MNSQAETTVVGMFNDMSAQKAADRLESAGIPHSNVSVIAGNESGKYKDYAGGAGEVGKGVAGGAGTGAAVGGGLGLLAGLTALAIPGFGPIIAAGPIAAALTGAGIGAASGGLLGGLTKAGISETDAENYAAGVRQGNVLVTVRTNSNLADTAAGILDDAGAIDIDDQSTTPGLGVSSTPRMAATPVKSGANVKADLTQGETLSVVEEELRVGKREVVGGKVRVYTNVTERPVEESITLREEHVNVERRPVNRAATDADFTAFKEGSIELTESREEAVVGKTARVVEEVVVGKESSERTETIRDTVRRQDVEVEKTGATGTNFDEDYRSDFQTRYGSRKDLKYESYAPAYQLGSKWANDAKYKGREWDSVESDMRTHWSSQGQGAWEDVKDAVRHSWDKVRGRR